jgi:hypothetical protein
MGRLGRPFISPLPDSTPALAMIVPTLLAAVLTLPARTGEAPVDVRAAVGKGLKWLAARQAKDGSWSGTSNPLTVTPTAYAGLALLMEGSTPAHGEYAPNIRAAMGWFEKNAQPGGLLVPPADTGEQSRLLAAHATAVLFLTCAYDADDDEARRERLERLLAAAVGYAAEKQTKGGGWGFTAGNSGYEDTMTTATMLHALFAARRAGIDVPQSVTRAATRYLVRATAPSGGVAYGGAGGVPQAGTEQPLPAALAASAVLTAPGLRPESLGKWVRYARTNPPQFGAQDNMNTFTLLHDLSVARAANALGERGHRAVLPGVAAAEEVRWLAVRAGLYRRVAAGQSADGSWRDVYVGPASSTALALIILQLDNNHLPAFSR